MVHGLHILGMGSSILVVGNTMDDPGDPCHARRDGKGKRGGWLGEEQTPIKKMLRGSPPGVIVAVMLQQRARRLQDMAPTPHMMGMVILYGRGGSRRLEARKYSRGKIFAHWSATAHGGQRSRIVACAR
jgi:hypothetical protein